MKIKILFLIKYNYKIYVFYLYKNIINIKKTINESMIRLNNEKFNQIMKIINKEELKKLILYNILNEEYNKEDKSYMSIRRMVSIFIRYTLYIHNIEIIIELQRIIGIVKRDFNIDKDKDKNKDLLGDRCKKIISLINLKNVCILNPILFINLNKICFIIIFIYIFYFNILIFKIYFQ